MSIGPSGRVSAPGVQISEFAVADPEALTDIFEKVAEVIRIAFTENDSDVRFRREQRRW